MLPGSGCNLIQHSFVELPAEEEISFIFIGRVMRLKGIDEFLLAANIIKRKYSNTKFYIAGWNEQPEYMKKLKRLKNLVLSNMLDFVRILINGLKNVIVRFFLLMEVKEYPMFC